MRKFLLIMMLGILFLFPSSVFAQADLKFASVSVQLWPEYDQPSMLVITDFALPAATTLPVTLTFRIPKDANLIAVASSANGNDFLLEAYDTPIKDDEWQIFTMTITQNIVYRFEYYQPLAFNGNQRIFSYLWDGAYAVDKFNVLMREPLDMTSLSMDPAYESTLQADGSNYYDSGVVKLDAGEQFALNLQYEKTTTTLLDTTNRVEPSAPVDENTPGRVSLSNSLPYIIGGLGVIMIVGGVVYYWQSGRRSSGGGKPRRRSHSHAEDQEGGEEAYCPQCGARAKGGDRFCRTCGARLKHQQED